MNLLPFIIFIIVSYYCAYVLDFVFTNFCKLLQKNPFGSINEVIIMLFSSVNSVILCLCNLNNLLKNYANLHHP